MLLSKLTLYIRSAFSDYFQEGYEPMKKRISILACLVFGLVVLTPPQKTAAYSQWMEDYGDCMMDNLTAWGDCYSNREAAIANCGGNPDCIRQARDAWWNCQSNDSNIFGNCVGGIDIDYYELDFCANARSVYDSCTNQYQCEGLEDPDERFICNMDRFACRSESGLDYCQ